MKRSALTALLVVLGLAVAAVFAFDVRPDAAQTGDYVIESVAFDGGALRVIGRMTADDAAVTGVDCAYSDGRVTVRLLCRASLFAGSLGDPDSGRIDITIPTGGRKVDEVVFQGWTKLDRVRAEITREMDAG